MIKDKLYRTRCPSNLSVSDVVELTQHVSNEGKSKMPDQVNKLIIITKMEKYDRLNFRNKICYIFMLISLFLRDLSFLPYPVDLIQLNLCYVVT